MKAKIIVVMLIIAILYIGINSKPMIINEYQDTTTINDNYIYDNTFICNNTEVCIGINIETNDE